MIELSISEMLTIHHALDARKHGFQKILNLPEERKGTHLPLVHKIIADCENLQQKIRDYSPEVARIIAED